MKIEHRFLLKVQGLELDLSRKELFDLFKTCVRALTVSE